MSENKVQTPKKKKISSWQMMKRRKKMKNDMQRYNSLQNIISVIIVLIIIAILMSGIVNQRQVFKGMVDFVLDISGKFSDIFVSLGDNDNDFVVVTSDGIYFNSDNDIKEDIMDKGDD